MLYGLRRISHALWSYVNQSITPSETQYSVWKPSRFWYLYKIKLLENCWLQQSYLPAHENQGKDEYRKGN